METLTRITMIALGGAAGAVARYLINISPLSRVFEHFPLPTFVINISGSFLIGLLMVVFADKIEVSEGIRMMLIVGFLGAFTTFSTFEAETYGLIAEGHVVTSFAYVLLSVALGLVGFAAGVSLGRNLTAGQ